MAKLEHYINVGKKRLRCGYTTGTCAAAATAAACRLLLRGVRTGVVYIDTPAGIRAETEPVMYDSGLGWASCAVQKDGGDDPDATDGTLIFARAELSDKPGIEIIGGSGVGRVTLPGLDQPVGAAAINSVPRRMITYEAEKAAESVGYTSGLRIIISAPDGEKIAAKTFNPRLGIIGGISILGTSGIVRPMSEQALLDTLYVELDMLHANGILDVVVTPGNYGEYYARDTLGLDPRRFASCSNYVGGVIDYASMRGFNSLMLIGHFGKLIKVAGGCMNTHSKVADGRRETLCAHTAICGGDAHTVRAVFDSVTTDAALDILEEAGVLQAVMSSICGEFDKVLRYRAGADLQIEGLFFSNKYGVLGKTPGADGLLEKARLI